MRYTRYMRPVSYRLPESTVKLIAKLAQALGMTYTQVLILAVDRLATQELKRK